MTPHVVSTKTLVKSTIFATIMAAVVFVCFILPAEYNIDPTHIGHRLGLTALASHDDTLTETGIAVATERGQELIEVIVPAGKGIEYKFQMGRYDKMTYEWLTDDEPLYFDLHG